ncbi:50S ribosomal protein L4 [bacterium]|jgi:large subunit ribosomal protein L4|nr:50S ribosomal protein L4 [bacterium]MBT4335033.1 50S ribosomal protein L4 [bacterium]MBT4763883.1 50S ribosomal protein L4 [bacterium]MBT5401254.1 50S ribosomal protein L4 [bacterium]MBT5942787.1 50S ribosomal protein L4 [bacterium]
MPKVQVYNLNGEKVKEIDLNPDIFAIDVKPEVVQQVVVAQMANSREAIAHTKGRSEKRGGGRKPWKQKGTGRARHGSVRSPLWTGGGVTFGPTKFRNFKQRINKKVRKKAIYMALSDKVNNNSLILVEDLNIPEAKTKSLIEVLNKLPLKDKKVLLVLDKKNENIVRGASNLPTVMTLPLKSLNVVDLLKYEFVLMPENAALKIK